MIIEGLLSLVYTFSQFVLNLIPNIDLSLPADIVGGFINIIYGLAYIFPLGDFVIILSIYIVVKNFHIVYNIIRAIRSFLPF